MRTVSESVLYIRMFMGKRAGVVTTTLFRTSGDLMVNIRWLSYG